MTDAYGPVDFLILEFPAGSVGEASAKALQALIDNGVVALYDLMVVRKQADGSVSEVDIGASNGLASWARFAGARSGLLSDEDLGDVTDVLEPGAGAVILVYENRWAAPFVEAARGEGVEVVASARLPAQVIMDALDVLESIA